MRVWFLKCSTQTRSDGHIAILLPSHTVAMRDESHAPRRRWARAILFALILVRGKALARPQIPIEVVQDVRELFQPAPDSTTVLICEEAAFVERVTRACGGRFMAAQIRSWFRDVDIASDGIITWEAFTNAVLHEAAGPLETDVRAMEYIPNNQQEHRGFEHRGSILCVAINPFDSHILTGGTDGILARWDPLAENCTHALVNARAGSSDAGVLLSHVPCPVLSIATGHRGFVFACGANKTINVYTPETFEVRVKYVSRETYNELARQGNAGKVVGRSKTVVNTVVLMGVDDMIQCIEVCTIDRTEFLFLGLQNGRILKYNLRNPNHLELHPVMELPSHSACVQKLYLDVDMKLLVSCGWDGVLYLTNPTTGRRAHTLSIASDIFTKNKLGHKRLIAGFAYLTTHRLLASISRERDALIWNPAIDNPLARLSHPSLLVAICGNDTDGQFVTVAEDRQVRVWDAHSYALVQSLVLDDTGPLVGRLGAVAFIPDASTIVSCDSRPHTWSMRRRGVAFERNGGHIEPVVCVAAGERFIATADPHTVSSWDPRSGRRRAVWMPFVEPVVVVAIATVRGGRAVSVLGSNGMLQTYCLANGLQLGAVEMRPRSKSCAVVEGGPTDSTVTSVGRTVFVATDATVEGFKLEVERGIVQRLSGPSVTLASPITAICEVPNLLRGASVVAVTTAAKQLHIMLGATLSTVTAVTATPAIGLHWLPRTRVMLAVASKAVQVIDPVRRAPIRATIASPYQESFLVSATGVSLKNDCEFIVTGDNLGRVHRVDVRAQGGQCHINFAPELLVSDAPIATLEMCSGDVGVALTVAGFAVVFSLERRSILGNLGQERSWVPRRVPPPAMSDTTATFVAELSFATSANPGSVNLGDVLSGTFRPQRLSGVVSLLNASNLIDSDCALDIASPTTHVATVPNRLPVTSSQRELPPLLTSPNSQGQVLQRSLTPSLGKRSLLTDSPLVRRTAAGATDFPLLRNSTVAASAVVDSSLLRPDEVKGDLPPVTSSPIAAQEGRSLRSRLSRRYAASPELSPIDHCPLSRSATPSVGHRLRAVYDSFTSQAEPSRPTTVLGSPRHADWVGRVSSLIKISEL
jgi:WD40 repeat protein